MRTWHDVFPYNCDIVVTVWSGLLVYEAESMHEFMSSDSRPHAPRSLQWQGLASPSLPQKWPAARDAEHKFYCMYYHHNTLEEAISRSYAHPYLGWMSRKLPSWVRGTNLTHVPAEMSCIPVSMVILSMSSKVRVKECTKKAKYEIIKGYKKLEASP